MTAPALPFGGRLEAVLPVYEIPAEDLVGEVLVPAMTVADEVRVAAGFFSSRCLAQIAPGLAALLPRATKAIRILLSPEISADDREAIDRGIRDPSEALNAAVVRLLTEAEQKSPELPKHCLKCLSYLVASGRLELRFVLMNEGMYHKKQWLFRDAGAWLGVHGSGNATTRGLLQNGEQMTIDRTWRDGGAAADRVDRIVHQFDRQWDNRVRHSLTLTAEQALAFLRGRADSHKETPTVADFWRAWQADHEAGLEPALPPNAPLPTLTKRLQIPTALDWRTGRYAHQGQAVDAFMRRDQGIFSIATGGGKTKAALISAAQIQGTDSGQCLVVILAPTRPLVTQWKREVRLFGVEPVVLAGMSQRTRAAELGAVEAALQGDRAHTEVLIATSSLFGSDESLRTWLARVSDGLRTILIADEVHNLGTAGFLDHRPLGIRYRLGLSATPVRQYDPTGTARLQEYFGEVLIDFSLGDAIRSGCLVPYDYLPHVVTLAHDELDLYLDLTRQLQRLGFGVDDDGFAYGMSPKVEGLLRKRRSVLEQADAKISALAGLLSLNPRGVTRTLIYTSAKATLPGRTRQLVRVNAILSDLGIISHQLTSVETATDAGDEILGAFGRGDYQVLTAMKVLDEGVDIPQTETAYLLASSTVTREWTQRRGRVLRAWPGKGMAYLHDFVVVPPHTQDEASKGIVRGELRRAIEFGRFSRNEFDPGGSAEVERQLEQFLRA